MTDPAQPPSAPPGPLSGTPSGTPSTGAQLGKVFMFAAASDILTGLVLAAIGFNTDEQVLTVIGVAMALIGTAVTCWLIIRSSRPQQL